MLSEALSDKEAGIVVKIVGNAKSAKLVVTDKNQTEETNVLVQPLEESSSNIDLLKAQLLLARKDNSLLQVKNREANERVALLEAKLSDRAECCNSEMLEKILEKIDGMDKNIGVLIQDRQPLGLREAAENEPNVRRVPDAVIVVDEVRVLDYYYMLSMHDGTLNTRVKNLMTAYWGPEVVQNAGYKLSGRLAEEDFIKITMEDTTNIHKLVLALERDEDTKLPGNRQQPFSLDETKEAIKNALRLLRR